MKALLALLLALAPVPLAAQVRPAPGPGDARVQTIEYSPDQVVQLQAAPGYQITVALGSDERIESVAVGDSAAWKVTANKRGDYLFIKPVTSGVTTNMVVVTDLRLYAFELTPAYGPTENLPFAVRFLYPATGTATVTAAASPAETAPAPISGRYKLGGDKLLRPTAMSDDGVRTTIEWPATASLPAIYGVGADGRETLVTGNVRGGSVVVDSILRSFTFRQDDRTATAIRFLPPQEKSVSAAPTGDPRLTLSREDAEAGDIRPIVARASGGPSPLVLIVGLAIFAVLLFVLLDARRRTLEAPTVQQASSDRTATPLRDQPPLYVPPAPVAAPPVAQSQAAPAPFVLPQPPVGPPRVVYVPQPAPPQSYPQPPIRQQPVFQQPAQPRSVDDSALVIDQSGPQDTDATGAPSAPGEGPRINGADGTRSTASTARATATQLVNRATTVPQGTLIPAVLETALDSTRAGFSRAIVSRDVRGFDGARILIPRGSRLVGEYSGNAASGQNRAIITWTRLVRPDGVAIAIASPAADAYGRGGVRAHVNTHLIQRLGSAILQSALEVGVNLASRPTNGSVIVGLPSSVGQNGGGLLGQNTQPAPTLTVRAGTSIAVFVARDLDFTGVGNPK